VALFAPETLPTTAQLLAPLRRQRLEVPAHASAHLLALFRSRIAHPFAALFHEAAALFRRRVAPALAGLRPPLVRRAGPAAALTPLTALLGDGIRGKQRRDEQRTEQRGRDAARSAHQPAPSSRSRKRSSRSRFAITS
jgi:hypothetical protein